MVQHDLKQHANHKVDSQVAKRSFKAIYYIAKHTGFDVTKMLCITFLGPGESAVDGGDLCHEVFRLLLADLFIQCLVSS